LERLLESSLEVEAQDLIGSKRWEHDKGRWTYRNGSYERGLLTGLGYIAKLKVPRVRGVSLDVALATIKGADDPEDAVEELLEAKKEAEEAEEEEAEKESEKAEEKAEELIEEAEKRVERQQEKLETEQEKLKEELEKEREEQGE